MMRSVVEEASSVAKAIEKAWQSAGKPEEFSVKVFQQATRNFLGFTSKLAKVGIFFTAPQPHTNERRENGRRQYQRPFEREQRGSAQRPSRPHQEQRVEAPQERGGYWSDDLITAAKEWLRGALDSLDMADRRFAISARGSLLEIRFDGAMGREEREGRIVLNSFAHLLTEVLRNKFGQRTFRNLKISVDSTYDGGSDTGADNRV